MKASSATAIAAWGLVTLLTGQMPGSAATPSYHITDLGTLPGESSCEALALNDRGQVVCVCSTGGLGKAFLWQKGRMTPLPLLNGFSTLSLWPRAISNQGQIVGTAFGSNLDTRRAFLFDKGVIQDLGTPQGEYSEATGINDKGQVVGKSYSETVDDKGRHQISRSYTFLWSKEAGFQRISSRPDDFGENVSGINNAGQVVGASMTIGIAQEKAKRAALPPDKQPYHGDLLPSGAFLWQNGQTTSLSVPQAWSSGAVAINQRGDILEAIATYPQTTELLTFSQAELDTIQYAIRHSHHTVLWKSGQAEDLGEMGSEPEVTVAALNNADNIVGFVRLADNSGFRAFLWRDGKRFMLTDLIPPADGWTLEEAKAINNHGQIIGQGRHNGQQHAFLLTPQ